MRTTIIMTLLLVSQYYGVNMEGFELAVPISVVLCLLQDLTEIVKNVRS